MPDRLWLATANEKPQVAGRRRDRPAHPPRGSFETCAQTVAAYAPSPWTDIEIECATELAHPPLTDELPAARRGDVHLRLPFLRVSLPSRTTLAPVLPFYRAFPSTTVRRPSSSAGDW